jgi:hypothetical protein
MKLAIAFTLALLPPAVALACPSCARDSGPWAAALIGGMIGVPYLVAIAAVRAIRAMDGGGER